MRRDRPPGRWLHAAGPVGPVCPGLGLEHPGLRAPSAQPTRVTFRTARWHLPLAISRAAVTSTDGTSAHTVLAGGMLPDDTSTARTTILDPLTGRTRPGPALTVAVHDAAGGLDEGRPAVVGGGNATEQSVVQALAGGRWSVVAHLPTTRSDLSTVGAGRSSLVVGGYDGVHVPTAVLAPRGSAFSRVGALRVGVRYAATAVLGHDAWVLGGEVDHHELGVVQRLDLRTGRTRVVGHLPRPLGHATAVPVGRRLLVLGGRTDPDTQTDAAWWFDPATSRWTRAGRLPRPLSDAAVVVGDGRAWLLGGEDPGVTDRVVEVHWS